MSQFTGTWVASARPLDGSRPFLVSPFHLDVPETGDSFEVWVTRGDDGALAAPRAIAMEIERLEDSFLARCDGDGWECILEARPAPLPGMEPGDGDVLQGLVTFRCLVHNAPTEDTESFTGVRPGGH